MMIVSVDEVVKVSTKYSCLGWEVSSRRARVCTSVMLKSKMRRIIPDITFKMVQVVNIGRSSEGNIRRSVPSSLFVSGEIITTVERLASVGKVGRVLPLTGSKYPTKSSQHQFRRQRWANNNPRYFLSVSVRCRVNCGDPSGFRQQWKLFTKNALMLIAFKHLPIQALTNLFMQ